ncbi:MAG: hypothetical protein IPG98_12870 [Burkholderiales bacterium]|nr:hypothetical protein [Burkholderiales bacterium]
MRMDPGIEQGRITALIIVNSRSIRLRGRGTACFALNAVADRLAKPGRVAEEITPIEPAFGNGFPYFFRTPMKNGT